VVLPYASASAAHCPKGVNSARWEKVPKVAEFSTSGRDQQSRGGTNDMLRDLKFQRREKGQTMSLLKWALIMLVVSLVAALFGFTDLSAASADVARVLFYIFLVVFLVLLIMGLMGARAARGS
jgi:uncharacterized membrane protein YtjA (UPF0391 family)